MSTKELKADVNALMDLEMMDAIVGGNSFSDSCNNGCTNERKPSCQPGHSHSGKTKKIKKELNL